MDTSTLGRLLLQPVLLGLHRPQLLVDSFERLAKLASLPLRRRQPLRRLAGLTLQLCVQLADLPARPLLLLVGFACQPVALTSGP